MFIFIITEALKKYLDLELTSSDKLYMTIKIEIMYFQEELDCKISLSIKEVIFMTITEVSQKYDITADTLRYYERIGLIPPVSRNSSGIRDYTDEDCNWVHFMKCMRGAGLSIEVLIEYISMFQKGSYTINARKELLIEQRSKLAQKVKEMQQTLERLDNKIDGYEERMLAKEKQYLADS
ncbi:HTH-type transcriptional regulator AdhR [Clostridium beijerinckii]|nr:HTH-type transcriptional regulator AdhR [Clostridium beijerinckii]OOM67936.1 HTH-type transcriptional regulator AdhR [Clostridium beijerinckii]CUU46691.1 putative transcriptional regulator (MerR family) (modular protein) [Clostridium beijerinckii]